MPTPKSLAPAALKVALGLAGTGLLALGLVFANAEGFVDRGFERALARNAPSVAEARGAAALAGSEDFWLRGARAAGTHPVSWSKTVAVGDRFTIGMGGAERLLEVVDVRELPVGSAGVDAGARQARLQLVTCRDVGHDDGHPVRLVIEAGEPLVPHTPAKPARAL